MKHFALSILLVVVAGCATQKVTIQEFATQEILSTSQLKERETEDDIRDLVVRLQEGDRVPLSLDVDTSLFAVAEDQVTLVAKRPLYIWLDVPEGIRKDELAKMSEQEQARTVRNTMVYLSPDGRQWVPFTSFRAAKRLFAIEEGSLSFGMTVGAKQGVAGHLQVRTRAKEERDRAQPSP